MVAMWTRGVTAMFERAAEGVGGVHVDLVLGDLHLVVVELPRLRLFHAGQIVDHQTAAEERVVGHVVGDHHGRVDAGRAGARHPRDTPPSGYRTRSGVGCRSLRG